MPILDVSFDYAVTYVPRGARVERTERATATMPVMVAEPDAAGAPRILDVDWPVTDGGRVFDLERLATVPVPIHRFSGAAVRPWNLFRAEGRDPLVPPESRRADLPARGDPVAFLDPAIAKALSDLKPVPPGALEGARRIVSSGEDAARAYAVARAAAHCVVDGVLMEPCGEPVWSIQSDHSTSRSRVDVQPEFAPGPHPLHRPVFPADRFDEAFEHAAWMATQGSRAQFSPRPTRVGGIRVPPDYVAAYDPLVDYGAAVIAGFADQRQGDAFHAMPRDCLLAWVDLRDARPLAEAGDAGAVLAGIEALRRFLGALPEPGPDSGEGAWVARNWLPGALRVVERAIERRPAETLAADEAALSGLSFATGAGR